MKPETTGHAPRAAPTDPLEIAKTLRDALAEWAARTARLVSVLRQWSKQKLALGARMTTLWPLNLVVEET